MDCWNIVIIESSFSVTRNVFTYPFDSIQGAYTLLLSRKEG